MRIPHAVCWCSLTRMVRFIVMKNAIGASAFVILASVAPSHALEIGADELALRAGVSFNPDQFHGGVQLDLGELFRLGGSGGVHLRPSLDLGIGNGLILGTLGGDLVFSFGG